MSGERMLAFLSGCNLEQQLGLRIVTQCAPVLKGVKISNLISVKPGQNRQVKSYLKGTRVTCTLLYTDKRKEILFLYRCDMLENYLRKAEVKHFLQSYGYLDTGIAGIFIRLRSRYRNYAAGNQEFPHELGVLLEYPVQDVEDFIRFKGKHCLMERYWKVYHDPEGAKRTFRIYDEARETAMEEILAGYPLLRVAVS